MRNIVTIAVAVCLLTVAGIASAQQARPATASTTTTTTMDDVLKAIRADMQGDRADIMAKNMTLTSEQAAKFWPLFAVYQKEQDVIIDQQLRAVQTFMERFEELDDAGALALMKGHFDRDTQMNMLRQKWLTQFQQVLGTKLAVRAMQIDRRLSLVQQIGIAGRIPLVH
jgi:Spy/CpxP family protein refolding chaperone